MSPLRGLHQPGHIMQRRVITAIARVIDSPGPEKLVTSNVKQTRPQSIVV